MYKFAIAFMTLFLAGCCCDPSYVPSYRRDNGAADAPVYRNNTVRWTYYVDYEPDDGKIVRYCELGDYQPHSLCTLTVEFYRTYVSNAYSDCGGAPAMTAYNGYVY